MTRREQMQLICGLILSTLGFFTDRASEIPIVMRIIAPGHWATEHGYDRLITEHYLGEGDIGFDEITDLTLTEFNNHYPDKIPRNPRALERFQLGASVLGGVPDINLHFFLRGSPHRHTWTMNRLRAKIEERWGTRPLWASGIIFFIGLILSATPLLSLRQQQQSVPTPSEPEPSPSDGEPTNSEMEKGSRTPNDPAQCDR